MAPQENSWTCSVCSFAWAVNALNRDFIISRSEALAIMGYPNCVNETYGCMSAQCVIDAFETLGFEAVQAWVTYDQAYSIMGAHTGVINPVGMYHFMGCRGVADGALWVANSAIGYRGISETLTREQFNALGPVQVIYLPDTSPA
jgi:hypothetical protein